VRDSISLQENLCWKVKSWGEKCKFNDPAKRVLTTPEDESRLLSERIGLEDAGNR